jgi:hypothetical protein
MLEIHGCVYREVYLVMFRGVIDEHMIKIGIITESTYYNIC